MKNGVYSCDLDIRFYITCSYVQTRLVNKIKFNLDSYYACHINLGVGGQKCNLSGNNLTYKKIIASL